jgi:SAM-dependent methyltransferase
VGVIVTNPDIALDRCGRCKAASAYPLPKQAYLDYFYRYIYPDLISEVAHQGYRMPKRHCDRFAKHIIQKMNLSFASIRDGSVRVLDYGGGDGTLAKALAKKLIRFGAQSVSVVVLDKYIPAQKEYDGDVSIEYSNAFEKIPDQEYDVVLASAVLEHVVSPAETTKELLRSLRENGVFYARTPYVEPFIRLFNQKSPVWNFFYPAHLHDLGPEFWNYFLNNFHLENEFQLLASQPSKTQVSVKDNPKINIVSNILKLPRYLFGGRYPFVGGWEVFLSPKKGE